MIDYGPHLLDDPVFRFARERAMGKPWGVAGVQAELPLSDFERIARSDPKHWKHMLRVVQEEAFQEIGFECMNRLRNMLRDKRLKVQLRSVDIFMRFWNTMPRHTQRKDRKHANPLMPFEEISHENVVGLAHDLLRAAGEEPFPEGDVDPDGAGGPARLHPTDPSGAGGKRSPLAKVHSQMQQHLTDHPLALMTFRRDSETMNQYRPPPRTVQAAKMPAQSK